MLINKLMSHYRLIGQKTTEGLNSTKYSEAVVQNNFKTEIGLKANGLYRHFRLQIL